MAKTKTLLDFFTSPKPKTPTRTSPESKLDLSKTSKSPKTPTGTPRNSNVNGSAVKRRARQSVSPKVEDEEETDDDVKKSNGHKGPKRRRIVIASDSEDSSDEYKPDKEIEESSEDEAMLSDYESETEKPKPKKRQAKGSKFAEFKSPKTTPKQSKIASSPKPTASPAPENATADTQGSSDVGDKEWVHLTYEWLKEDKIRDKEKRLKSDPNYDPKTLYVPEHFKKTITPAMRQWWEMKSEHFDTILFFKVGKFYELYHMDAVIGVNELGIVYMKGDFAHSGFPEIAYGRFSDALVQRGYKVARVEQTETPQMMEERCRKLDRPTKFDKVVTREICQITSKGTRTFTTQDGAPMAASNNYLLCVTEKVSGESSWSESEYGVCFIDASVGKFFIGQFMDDRHCSRLRTLTVHHPPVEVLYERESISKKTVQLFNSSLGNVKACPVSSRYWDTVKIMKFLVEKKYFSNEKANGVEWPEVLKEMLDEDDKLFETPKKEYELAMKAFSACVWYLKESLIEHQLLTMKLFDFYVPADEPHGDVKKAKLFAGQHMILDGITLRNLEILENNSTEVEGTLLQTMDFCSTNFGKRLFHHWLCSPVCDPDVINDRLNAVEDLEKVSYIADEVVASLRKLPDLERLLSRIHAEGLPRSKDHPDGRAIFYEEETYSERKILTFLSVLNGFKLSMEIISQFSGFEKDFRSKVLLQCVTEKDKGGCFPSLKEALEYFDTAFDHEQAKKDKCITPCKGVDEEYDAAIQEMKKATAELDDYLQQQRRKFQCKVTYFGSGRNRYQLEVPEHAAKHAGSQYEVQGQRKGFKRFYTEEIKEMVSRLTAAEDRRDAAQLDIMRRIFAVFDKQYSLWKSAVQCLSVLDVLISMMQYKKSSQVEMCRPEVRPISEGEKPFLKIVNGRHPSLLKCFTGDTYIPNSVYLGPPQELSEEIVNRGGSVVLVTGPNMGGKSTLMRQTGLLVIMAQMGSYVPAEKCIFTPVDRIFTRLGASDCITAGESTFFVEVSETACILQHATVHSLVLVDEFGRGTSTYDGTAIACAIVKELSARIDCRTLFSTHYHSLVEEFSSFPSVGLGHMACMVESDESHPALENITFLYKFMEGMCPKSYGFNVAHLAGIPEEVVQKGYNIAKEMERRIKLQKVCRKLLMTPESQVLERREEIRSLLKEL